MAALAVVVVVAALVVARAIACSVALAIEKKRTPSIEPGQGPPLSIVVPLYGWDERFLDLLDGLARAAAKYGAPVETIVVVDADHPRRAEIEARAAIEASAAIEAHGASATDLVAPSAPTPPASNAAPALAAAALSSNAAPAFAAAPLSSYALRPLAPALPLEAGDVDKVRRLRCGVRAATNSFVMLLDSDVVVDEEFLLRRVAAHVHDPSLRLSFALPAYRDPRGAGDAVLGAYTVHHNLLVFFLGWFLTRKGTSIGPSQLVRNDDGVLAGILDALRTTVADDHGLGRAVELRGESVRALPTEVVVHASDASIRASAAQVVRWMTSSKSVGPLLTPISLAWFVASVLLTGAGPILLEAGAVLFDPTLAIGGAAVMLLEGVVLALLDAQLTARAVDPAGVMRALWTVPAFMLATPPLFVRSMAASRIRWRGRQVAGEIVDVTAADAVRSAAALENGTSRPSSSS